MTANITETKRPRRWWHLAAILVMLLGLTALAGGAFAAAPPMSPDNSSAKEAQASKPQEPGVGNQPDNCPPGGSNYIFTQSTGNFQFGTTDIGNHCDDCTTNIALPFPVVLYKQAPFTSVNVSSNGNLQFSSADAGYSNVCLPMASFNNSIMAHWDDLYTADAASGQGIFTVVQGTTPNRRFVIEWRANFCCASGAPVFDFEVIMYENLDRFDMVYRTVPNNGSGATVGVQRDTGSLVTQYSCNTSSLSNGLYLVALPAPCTTPTPTATATPKPRRIIVQKLNSITNQPLPGWTMNLHAGPGCVGAPLQTQVTDGTGQAYFNGLATGNYSVAEVLQPGWTPDSGVCQNVTLSLNGQDEVSNAKLDSASSDSSAASLLSDSAQPLALPQNAKQASKPQITGPASKVFLSRPASPDLVLYDQYNNPGANGTSSQNFEPANDAFDNELADDFIVPAGPNWTIDQVEVDGGYFNGTGPAVSVNIKFYSDAGGLPGALIASYPNLAYTNGPGAGDFVIPVCPAASLPPGHYWMSVQVNMDFSVGGQWGWTNRTVASNSPAAWQNPGGGFGVCPVWSTRSTTCNIAPTEPDQMFRLSNVTCYPPAGDDGFNSGANVSIEINGIGTDSFQLGGPSVVRRATPCVGCGPGGRNYIETELLAMDLVGNSPLFGPVQIRESPTRPSLGRTQEQAPGDPYPADSFFDVFIEVQSPLGPLHNNQPIHVSSVINEIPPYDTPFISNVPVVLFDNGNIPRGRILTIKHIPLRPNTTLIIFRNRPVATPTPTNTPTNTPIPVSTLIVQKLDADTGQPLPGWKMQLHSGPNCGGPVIASLFTDGNGLATFNNLAPGQYSVQEILQPGYVPVGSGVCQNVLVTALAGAIPASPNYPPAGNDTFDSPVYASIVISGAGSDNFLLSGPNTVHRDNPCVGCGPGGRTTIDTEILAFDFNGNSSVFGPVHIRESPSRPSLGQIRQQQPGQDFPADSFFDVFAEIDTSIGTLHNNDPVHVQSVINGIPPYGDAYRSQSPVTLFNNQNQPIGTLISIKKIPVQPNTAFIIFRNRLVDTATPTPTNTPTNTPTFTRTPTNTPTNTPTFTRTSTPTNTPIPVSTLIVQKLDADTGQPLPGWKMQLHSGPNCGGPVIASLFTDGNGLATFNNLAPGQYSVQEILQPGYVPVGSGVCQNVLVTLRAGTKQASPNYPPAGDDTFDSPVYVAIVINGVGSDNFRLDGPNTVHRDNPCVGCGPGGRTTIDTEILAFDFNGNSSILGPVHIRESPSRPSLGQIRQQQPGQDFPADSFFDVFAEIDSSLGTLHNNDPVHVQSVINGIPPYGDAYRSQSPVTLFNNQNQPIGTLISIKKIPVQPNTAFIIFRNRLVPTNTPTATPTNTPTNTPIPVSTLIVQKVDADTGQPLPGWKMQLHQGPNCTGPVLASIFTDGNGLATFNNLAPGQYSVQEILQPGWQPVGTGVCQNVTVTAQADSGDKALDYPPAGDDTFDSPVYASITITGAGSDILRLDGPTTVHRADPCVGCGPGGRTTIDAEIMAMQFTGNSSVFGPVHIRESPSRPSLGQIRQQQPGEDFPADSFFDVFAEIDTSMGQLHNEQPMHVSSVIHGIPPYGDAFRSEAPVLLYGSTNTGQPVGTINSIKKIPVQPGTTFIIFRNRQVLTPTPTPTCKPFLVGHVTLQGIPQPDPRNATKALTLTLSGPATATILLPPLDNNGYYTVNVSTLPAGTYQWRLKGPKYLASCGTVQLTGGCPPVQVEHSTLRTGDANDDNIVNISDFNILKTEFGTSGTGLRSDFNNDSTVSITDFNLLKNNFGTAAGCPPLFSPNQGPNGYRAGPHIMAAVPLPGRR